MGNSDSRHTFKKGSVLITLDNKHIHSGDKITGTVSYKLLEKFPAEKLQLELYGTEKIMWEGTDKKNHDPKHNGKIVMKKTFLQETKIVKTFDKFSAEIGTESFQFEFKIPEGSPSSLLFLGSKESKIQVSYKLFARMEEASINGTTHYKPL